jgi:hypothetical protein
MRQGTQLFYSSCMAKKSRQIRGASKGFTLSPLGSKYAYKVLGLQILQIRHWKQ